MTLKITVTVGKRTETTAKGKSREKGAVVVFQSKSGRQGQKAHSAGDRCCNQGEKEGDPCKKAPENTRPTVGKRFP